MRNKFLYRMNSSFDKIEKHELGEECMPQLIDRYQYGSLYRCKTNSFHDHYGYLTREEAKLEAIQLIKQELSRLNQLLKELGED